MGIYLSSLKNSFFPPVISRLGKFIYHDDSSEKRNEAVYNARINPNPPSDVPVKALAYGGLLAGLISSFSKIGKTHGSLLEKLRDWSFPVASFGVSALSFVLDYFSIDNQK